jgi:hypothetical protein
MKKVVLFVQLACRSDKNHATLLKGLPYVPEKKSSRGIFPRWLGWLFGWLFRAAASFAGQLKKIAILMRVISRELHFSRTVDMREEDWVLASLVPRFFIKDSGVAIWFSGIFFSSVRWPSQGQA